MIKRRMTTWMFIAAIAMLCGSCTFYRLALRYADWFVAREIDKTFDLNDQQETQVKQTIAAEMPWVKQVWIAELSGIATATAVRWGDGLSEEDHRWLDGELLRMREKLARRLAPAFAPIAVSFSTEQLGHAAMEFAKRNEKWSDLIKLEDEDLTKKRRDRLEDSMENWYGKITKAQAEQLCEIFGCKRRDVEQILVGMMGFQGQLLALFRDEKTPALWSKTVIRWSADAPSMLPPTLREPWRKQRAGQSQRLAQADRLMTPEQRKNAIKRTSDLAADLDWFSKKVD